MAKDNVDVIETVWSDFRKGDLDAVAAAVGEQAELHVQESLPWGGTYTGPEGFRDYASKLLAAFQDFKTTPEKVLGADDDHVVVVASSSGRAPAGGRFEGRSVWVYKLRDGKIAGAEAYTDTAAVNEALS